MKNTNLLEKTVFENCEKIYGKNASGIISERLDNELGLIEEQNSAFAFLLAQKIVKKSIDMGYNTVTSGAVGSSFVSFLLGITEINPLTPHYVCPKCKHIEFAESEFCGYDLKDKICPVCGEIFHKDGFNIPYEMFFGENGEKCADININVSPEIFEDLKDSICIFCKEYFEGKIDFKIKIENGGAKLELYNEVINDNFALKLLLNDDLTGVKPKSIPFYDNKTWELIENGGCANISGFSDFFDLCGEAKPKSIDDLTRCMGLVYGTGTWNDNGNLLITQHKLNEIISCRDDVMIYLMKKGYDRKTAFALSERIRKGMGLTEEQFEDMKKNGIPLWYIQSLCKIKYLFPRAHCAEYGLMAYRLAYLKANYKN